MTWYFLTFGGGDFRYRLMAHRLGRQARRLGGVTPITVTDRTLAKYIGKDAAREIKMLAESEPRGYGLWAWKPLLTQAILSRPDALGVIYADAGCELNLTHASQQRLQGWLEDASESGYRLWVVEGPWTERMYSKRAVTGLLGLTGALLDNKQIQSGAWILAKTAATVQFVDEWVRLSSADGHSLLRDPCCPDGEDVGFVAHRHDQSVFSCLARVSGWVATSNETHFGPNGWHDAGSSYPIWTIRNRRLLLTDSPPFLRRLEGIAARLSSWMRRVGV